MGEMALWALLWLFPAVEPPPVDAAVVRLEFKRRADLRTHPAYGWQWRRVMGAWTAPSTLDSWELWEPPDSACSHVHAGALIDWCEGDGQGLHSGETGQQSHLWDLRAWPRPGGGWLIDGRCGLNQRLFLQCPLILVEE